MSELMGDEMLFSLWPDQFLNKPPGLDWLLKDQQFVPVPVVLLDDGRFAFKSDDGQICLVDGLQGMGEENCQNLTPNLEDPTAELPPLSDATIKSLLVQGSLGLDAALGLVGSDMPEMQLEDRDLSEVVPDEVVPDSDPLGVDDDLKALVSFRCQFCSFSSTDVPSLMEHSRTQHDQPVHEDDESLDSAEDIENSLSEVPAEIPESMSGAVEQFVYYLCSECKEGFTSLTQCRDHMIIDHKMVLDEDREKEIEAETVQVEDEDVEKIEESREEMKEVGRKEEEEEEEDLPPPKKYSPPPSPKPTLKDFLAAKLPKPRTKPKDYDPEYEAKPHKCAEPMCIRRFSTLSCLQIHKQCHAQDERSFCCLKCSELFFKWGQCAFHLWRDHKIDVDLYTCNVCGVYKTTTRRNLESHKKIHSEERPYKCQVCDKGFKQPTQLVNHTSSVHKKAHKESVPKWYMAQKCEVCLKTYADSKCLKKHMQAVHSKLKPYKCQICGHMSARKAMLQVHIRQHTGEKPFACSICTFKTGDHNSLRRHMMRHTGDKPYKCPHCVYSSIQSSSFKAHLQSKHPGQGGSFSCRQCHFATVSEESYRKHISDHKLNLIPPSPSDAELFPENMAAASLVFHSFGASRCDITASATSRDGMKQTITISIPQADGDGVTDDEDTAHGFLPDTGGITIPAEPDHDQSLICFPQYGASGRTALTS